MQKVLTVSQMRKAEQMEFSKGISELELMNRAVSGIFEVIDKTLSTLVVCGSGNNAGDGLGVAIELKKHGSNVAVMLLNERFSPCGKMFFEECKTLGVKFETFTENYDFSKYNQVLDCIFGIGFHGQVDGIYKSAITRINQTAIKVVSIDVPSGLNAENGMTDLAIKSDLNVAVGALKSGLVLNKAKDYIKNNVVIKLFDELDFGGNLVEKTDFSEFFSERENWTHKGKYGYVGILGGSLKYSGAVKLANESLASLRSGAGVSRLIVPTCIENAVSPYLIVSTLFPIPSENGTCKFNEKSIDEALNKLVAVSVGMGMTDCDETSKIVNYILKNKSLKVVVDADAINAIAKFEDVKHLLSISKCSIVLTPHLLEFSRISGKSIEEINASPVSVCENFARENKVVLLLKGTTTIITDGEHTFYSSSGSSGMATAGSGDVLDGILTGLLGYNDLTPKLIACGAFLNGLAGEFAEKQFGQISMLSSDTLANIALAVKNLQN